MRILTFDIEDWFHILDNSSTKTVADWKQYKSRIQIGMDKVFEIIDNANVSATFFVVGWMAEKYPELIREISERGYEIGSHTHLHQLAYEQDRNTFYKDVEKSIKTLDDCTGKKSLALERPDFQSQKKTNGLLRFCMNWESLKIVLFFRPVELMAVCLNIMWQSHL